MGLISRVSSRTYRFKMDQDFLEECSGYVTHVPLTSVIDLKDHLRQNGFIGNNENKQQIIRFLKAEYYINLENEKEAKIQENQIFIRLLKCLKMTAPPNPDISITQFFNAVNNKIKKTVMDEINERDVNKFLGGRSMCPDQLNPNQIDATKRLVTHLNSEYQNRMKVLAKRLDVTIQSFNWSKRAAHHQDKISRNYQGIRHKLDKVVANDEFSVNIEDLMAARESILYDAKTSEGSFRVQTSLNKVLMKADIPDRGGRAYEYQTPVKESFQGQEDKRNMPKFQSRQGAAHDPNSFKGDRGGRGGGGRGRGRGDFRVGRGGGRGGRGGNQGGGDLPFFGSTGRAQGGNQGGNQGGYQPRNNQNQGQGGYNQNQNRGGYNNRGGGRGGRGGGRGRNNNVSYGGNQGF